MRVQGRMAVRCGGGGSVVQQPLVRRGAAAAADRAGSTVEGNPRVGSGVLLRVGLTPPLLKVLMLVIVVVVVIGPQKALLALAQPGDSSAGRLLAGGLLGHDGGAVDVVVLHV